MLQDERLNEIMDILNSKRSASYANLAKQLHVSQATVRRDSDKLFSHGLVEKVYGGIILFGQGINTMPIITRMDESLDAKRTIAKQAFALIKNDMTLFIYGSSTTFQLIPFLQKFHGLRILTNSLEMCRQLGELGIETYCTGGKLRTTDGTFIGSYASESISNFHAELFFFSPTSITMRGEILDFRDSSIAIINSMRKHSDHTYVLCDSSKFNNCSFFKICNVNEVDGILCEKHLPESVVQAMKNK